MRAEELITEPRLAEEIATEANRLPTPPREELEALRARMARTERPPLDRAWPAFLREALERKDTRYAAAPHSHRLVVGPALVLAKRAFRLAFQPFINEVMRRQVEFNEAILHALATQHEFQQENARLQAQWRQDVEARLTRLEAAGQQAEPRPRSPKHSSG
jgi:hypothetical protein